MSATADVESRPEVGSSSKIINGSVRSSVPIFTLFRSPSLINLMGVLAHFSNLNK